MKSKLLLALCFFAGYFSQAQVSLVKDISGNNASSSPQKITVFNGHLVMVASDENNSTSNGFELWDMDSSGHWKFTDVYPGAMDGCLVMNDVLGPMAVIDTTMYLAANNGTAGTELYSWTGVNAPVVAADIRPGIASSDVHEVRAFNGKIYFTATLPAYGRELWVYDPARATAKMVKDLYAGTYDSYPADLTIFQNKLYFSARTGTSGYELFVYDPVADSISMVADTEPGVNGSSPNSFVVVNNKLYLFASTAANGAELYSFDTTAGVQRLTDIRPGAENSVFVTNPGEHGIGVLNSNLYFAVRDSAVGQRFYKYDVSTGTLSYISLFNNMPTTAASNRELTFYYYDNSLFFSADDGVHGYELWQYDGLSAPSMIADIATGTDNGSPYGMTAYNGALYFGAYTQATGTDLFKYQKGTTVQRVSAPISISIFPNPARNIVYVNLNESNNQNITITVTNITGQKLCQRSLIGSHTEIDVKGWSRGIYLITVENGSDKATKKIILE